MQLSCSLALEAGWRQAGGRLEASLKDLQLFGQPCSLGAVVQPGWRQAGGRLEAGWRHHLRIYSFLANRAAWELSCSLAGGRLEATWVTTRFWLLFRRLFEVGPAWAGGQAYLSMVGQAGGRLEACWRQAEGRLEAGWRHHLAGWRGGGPFHRVLVVVLEKV